MRHGQVVLGPPGSGKTTYCRGMREFLRLANRRVVIVSLDPANGSFWRDLQGTGEDRDIIDIEDLVSASAVARELRLGPNGSIVFCMEFVASHMQWLADRINRVEASAYIIIDLPGQVELVTHYTTVSSIVAALRDKCGLGLCAVHLVDATNCSSASRFISVVLLSLITMMRLELPHINVLSKVDLLREDDMDFPLDFYTDMYNPSLLLDKLKTAHSGSAAGDKYRRLNEALVDLVESQNLVCFSTLDVQDPDSMRNIYVQCQKALGLSL